MTTVKHPYRKIATKIVKENLGTGDYTLGQFMKTWNWKTAQDEADRIANKPWFMHSEGEGKFVALWMWVKASEMSDGRLTISVHETPIYDAMLWKWAAKIVHDEWGMFPEVWAVAQPYQLVLV